MKKQLLESSIGTQPKSITLRTELLPVPKTQEYLSIPENWDKLKDEARNAKYSVVIDVLDREHKKVIERGLTRIKDKELICWDALGNLLETKDKKIADEEKKIRSIISDELKADVAYDALSGKKAFGNKGYLLTTDVSPEEREAILEFDNFTVYFGSYYKTRENMYSNENIGVAVSNRIVNENFPILFHNMTIFANILKETPDIREQYLNEAKTQDIEWNNELFETYNGMNLVLNQTGIDIYNALVGIINKITNLYAQQAGKNNTFFSRRSNYLLTKMHKQILSDSSTRFIIEKYEDDNEAIGEIKALGDYLNNRTDDNVKEHIIDLINEFNKIPVDEIIVPGKELPNLSLALKRKWNCIELIIRNCYNEKADKILKAKYIRLSDIQEALEYNKSIHTDDNENKTEIVPSLDSLGEYLGELLADAEKKYDDFREFTDKYDYNIPLNQIDIKPIKDYMDAWKQIIHFLKMFVADKEDEEIIDSNFSFRISDALSLLKDFELVYNKTRNYVTQKPYKTEKIRLRFNNPTLGDGWSKDKEREYGVVLLRKEGKYYFAISNPMNKPTYKCGDNIKPPYYEKMVYSLFKDCSKMIPKCSTQLKEVKNHFGNNNEAAIVLAGENFVLPLEITKEIYDLNNVTYNGKKKWQKEYAKIDAEGYRTAVHKWCGFCIDFVKKYRSTAEYDFSGLKAPEEYETVADLYHDLDKIFYKISFTRVAEADIERMLDNNQIFLFQIYNQDYSEYKHSESKKNLHTLYFEALFSEINIKERTFKLNGGMELFKRPASIVKPIKHPKGSLIINKTTRNHLTIPDEIYVELLNGLSHDENGNIIKGNLSREAEDFFENNKDNIVIKTKEYDLIKDRRYTMDQFFAHIPITINFNADPVRQFNANMLKNIQNSIREGEKVHLIGLDRGERNLISFSIIDLKGKIVKQGTFNVINGVDYQDKLTKRQNLRTEARKNWNIIENIKNLKEGYISYVIHELTKLMVEYNALVFMEDLNYGFKRGRFKIEKQVYQKFEMALINKLQYLVTSKEEGEEITKPGGIYRGYQLTTAPGSLKDVGHQCGIIFYVPPAYTSKIDPTTGFADVFNYSKLTNASRRKEFFAKFEDIFYDECKDCFGFKFDLTDFETYMTFTKTKWTAYTDEKNEKGKHIYNPEKKEMNIVNTTEILKNNFTKYGINFENGKLKNKILSIEENHENAAFWSELLYCFRIMMRLRDSANISNPDGTVTVIDRIISPVRNSSGERFTTPEQVTGNEDSNLPLDADSNGAYHIAMKGLFLIRNRILKIDVEDKNPKGEFYKITHPEWFEFMQTFND